MSFGSLHFYFAANISKAFEVSLALVRLYSFCSSTFQLCYEEDPIGLFVAAVSQWRGVGFYVNFTLFF